MSIGCIGALIKPSIAGHHFAGQDVDEPELALAGSRGAPAGASGKCKPSTKICGDVPLGIVRSLLVL